MQLLYESCVFKTRTRIARKRMQAKSFLSDVAHALYFNSFLFPRDSFCRSGLTHKYLLLSFHVIQVVLGAEWERYQRGRDAVAFSDDGKLGFWSTADCCGCWVCCWENYVAVECGFSVNSTCFLWRRSFDEDILHIVTNHLRVFTLNMFFYEPTVTCTRMKSVEL